mmetsp:Transcript_15135/g.35655  ORF Transcript_15135/g.35655 Transcript_15135/m.35655 type:complete len:138 (+) Transcript_15135:418-831(+)
MEWGRGEAMALRGRNSESSSTVSLNLTWLAGDCRAATEVMLVGGRDALEPGEAVSRYAEVEIDGDGGGDSPVEWAEWAEWAEWSGAGAGRGCALRAVGVPGGDGVAYDGVVVALERVGLCDPTESSTSISMSSRVSS